MNSLIAIVSTAGCVFIASIFIWFFLVRSRKQIRPQVPKPIQQSPEPTKQQPPQQKQQKQLPNFTSLRAFDDGIACSDCSFDGRFALLVSPSCSARAFLLQQQQQQQQKSKKQKSQFVELLPSTGRFSLACSLFALSETSVIIAIATSEPSKVFVFEITFETTTTKNSIKELCSFETPQRIFSLSILASEKGDELVVASCSVGDTILHLWNAKNGDKLSTFNVMQLKNNFISVSPEHLFLVVASEMKDVRTWKLNKGKLLRLPDAIGHQRAVKVACFGGKKNPNWLISTGSEDGTLKMWRMSEFYDAGKSPEQIWSTSFDSIGNINSLSISPDELILACGLKDKVLLFSAQNGEIKDELPIPHVICPAISVKFLNNSTLLITTTKSCIMWTRTL